MMVTMLDGGNGGCYPCTGLNEGGGVRRHAICTPRRYVL